MSEISKRAGSPARIARRPRVEVDVAPPAVVDAVAGRVERDRMLGGRARHPLNVRHVRPRDDGEPGHTVGWDPL